MKIILHDYGGYAFTLQLAEYLADNGQEVYYIHGGATQAVQRFCTSHKEKSPTALRIEGIELSKPFAKYSFFKRWIQEQEYAHLLTNRIALVKPDLIISANAPLDVQRKLQQTARKLKSPFIFWWQDMIGIASQKHLTKKFWILGWLLGVYYQSMEHRLLRKSEHVIAISEGFFLIAQRSEVLGKKISLLPNWAVLEDISILPKNNSWSHSHNLHDKFVFLYTGILGLKHDPKVFIRLAEHFKDNKEVMIVVVSGGKSADWLREQKKHLSLDNLQIHPFQPYEDYPNVLASADVLVAVLDEQAGSYSVPSKVLSYFCAGRSVLLSAPLDNLASCLVSEQHTGLVAPPNRMDLFCNYSQILYQSSHLRLIFGQNARKYAENNFDISKKGGLFLNLIKENTYRTRDPHP